MVPPDQIPMEVFLYTQPQFALSTPLAESKYLPKLPIRIMNLCGKSYLKHLIDKSLDFVKPNFTTKHKPYPKEFYTYQY